MFPLALTVLLAVSPAPRPLRAAPTPAAPEAQEEVSADVLELQQYIRTKETEITGIAVRKARIEAEIRSAQAEIKACAPDAFSSGGTSQARLTLERRREAATERQRDLKASLDQTAIQTQRYRCDIENYQQRIQIILRREKEYKAKEAAVDARAAAAAKAVEDTRKGEVTKPGKKLSRLEELVLSKFRMDSEMTDLKARLAVAKTKPAYATIAKDLETRITSLQSEMVPIDFEIDMEKTKK